MTTEPIYIRDYDYPLPDALIAYQPLPQRDASRLLVYQEGTIRDDTFSHLPAHLPEGTVILLNNTRVIEARLLFQKETGGVIEIFCLEPVRSSLETALTARGSVRWNCLIGGASKWKPGQVLRKEVEWEGRPLVLEAYYLSKETESFSIEFRWEGAAAFGEVLHAAGAIPLPPYIKRKATEADSERYQTVFARHEGSVAAPTAALHFTDAVFADLAKKNIHPAYVTLHVGAGTFKPVKSETVDGHQMHAEPFAVTAATLKQLIAATNLVVVGTTSLRTLESLHWLGVKELHGRNTPDFALGQWEPYELEKEFGVVPARESLGALLRYLEANGLNELHGQTSMIIIPGYRFQLPSALVTNFHQPQSTLLLLVCAFIGPDWKRVYQHAMDQQYRFLSYGDSSLLWRG